MTAGAQLGNCCSSRFADETFGTIHSLAGIFGVAITAVAVHTGQSVGGMYVVLNQQRWTLRVAIQCGVAPVTSRVFCGARSVNPPKWKHRSGARQ